MSLEEVEERIEAWHTSDIQIPLHVWLGWTEEQYKSFVESGVIP